jgi:hypothetical protein
MKATYSEKARQWGEGLALLQQATARLEEILGPSADLVSAEWDRIEDERGRPLYTLAIRDFTGRVEARFAPEELAHPVHVRARLYRLWGDLLQLRADEQHRKVQALVADQEGG